MALKQCGNIVHCTGRVATLRFNTKTAPAVDEVPITEAMAPSPTYGAHKAKDENVRFHPPTCLLGAAVKKLAEAIFQFLYFAAVTENIPHHILLFMRSRTLTTHILHKQEMPVVKVL